MPSAARAARGFVRGGALWAAGGRRREPWRALAERAVEPNGYYLPEWELAVNASARGRTGVSALSAMERTPRRTAAA